MADVRPTRLLSNWPHFSHNIICELISPPLMQRSWRIDWIRYEILPSLVHEAMQCNLVQCSAFTSPCVTC